MTVKDNSIAHANYRVNCCVKNSYRKKFVSINTARLLEEGPVQRQARWKKAKSKDLLAMH